jgi:uncharacterized protein YhbP (UPF0306 family)
MIDRGGIDAVLTANRYLVLGTASRSGQPWVTPVFFAQLGADRVVWVSSGDSRHSQNIAHRPAVAITVFDSTVEVGQAEAAYFEAVAGRTTPAETEAALAALNVRLPQTKQLRVADLHPSGPLLAYRADLRRSYALVRGGNSAFGNSVDIRVEV